MSCHKFSECIHLSVYIRTVRWYMGGHVWYKYISALCIFLFALPRLCCMSIELMKSLSESKPTHSNNHRLIRIWVQKRKSPFVQKPILFCCIQKITGPSSNILGPRTPHGPLVFLLEKLLEKSRSPHLHHGVVGSLILGIFSAACSDEHGNSIPVTMGRTVYLPTWKP